MGLVCAVGDHVRSFNVHPVVLVCCSQTHHLPYPPHLPYLIFYWRLGSKSGALPPPNDAESMDIYQNSVNPTGSDTEN